jgi:TRAP-type C4-dicarboxylate transport system substrate-binding protein
MGELLMRCLFAATALAATLGLADSAIAQNIDTRTLNVIGTWSFLTNYQALEKPFFTERLPEVSGGKLKANIKALNELNLKGTESLRLLKQGVFDFAFVPPIFLEDGGAVLEGLDIAGVARDYQMAKDIAAVWLPEVQQVMMEKHNAIILGIHTWPEQDFYCRGEVKNIEDLKGKRIRVQGASQSDLVTAFGATGVPIAFAEVAPAIEKGLVDCAITGTMPAYKAKWPDVTNSMFRLSVGFTAGMLVANLAMWNKLTPDTRALIEKEVKDLEERSSTALLADSEDGVYCTTGTGACPAGPPSKLKLYLPSEADSKARDRAVSQVVLKNWAKRCGADCTARWNELIGKKYGLVAKPD